MAEINEVELFGKLETKVDELFAGESSGHDKFHLIRVLQLALEI
jgi:hypothetical protein